MGVRSAVVSKGSGGCRGEVLVLARAEPRQALDHGARCRRAHDRRPRLRGHEPRSSRPARTTISTRVTRSTRTASRTRSCSAVRRWSCSSRWTPATRSASCSLRRTSRNGKPSRRSYARSSEIKDVVSPLTALQFNDSARLEPDRGSHAERRWEDPARRDGTRPLRCRSSRTQHRFGHDADAPHRHPDRRSGASTIRRISTSSSTTIPRIRSHPQAAPRVLPR